MEERYNITQELSEELVQKIKTLYFKKLGYEHLIAMKTSPTDQDIINMGAILSEYEDCGMELAKEALLHTIDEDKKYEITGWTVEFNNPAKIMVESIIKY